MLLLFLLSDKFTLSPIMCRVFTRLKEAEMERYPASWLDKRAVTSAVTLTQPHSWDNGCFVVKEKQKKRCVLSASLFKECLKKLSVARKCHVVCVCVCVCRNVWMTSETLYLKVLWIFFSSYSIDILLPAGLIITIACQCILNQQYEKSSSSITTLNILNT